MDMGELDHTLVLSVINFALLLKVIYDNMEIICRTYELERTVEEELKYTLIELKSMIVERESQPKNIEKKLDKITKQHD